MRRTDRRWIIVSEGKTFIAQWKNGKVVLDADSRTPEECFSAAMDKGWEGHFISWITMGAKTRGHIEALIPAGNDWEPYAMVTKYE